MSPTFVAGTAIGGTQDKYRIFIENCHVHADRIVAALTGGRSRRVLSICADRKAETACPCTWMQSCASRVREESFVF